MKTLQERYQDIQENLRRSSHSLSSKISESFAGKPIMHELKVTMLGPRAVGKTSLLTAMYEQFANNIGKINLELIADGESEAILQDRLIELKSLADDFEASGGLEGTQGEPDDLRSFKFGLGRRGKSPSLELHFWDYPGEFHSQSSEVRRKFLKELLKDCVAVIIAVDASALMEQNGKWHEMRNRTQQIRNLFGEVYQELDSPRLVIFAPIRCEKYMQNEQAANALVAKIKEGYRGLLDFLGADDLRSKVAVVVTPVQTIGTVIFSYIREIDGKPHFYFRKVSHDAGYAPKDSEQPLRYLLSFLLKLHLAKRSSGFFGFLRQVFAPDEHLEEAIQQLAQGCKSSDGFAVIQSEGLLK